MRRDILSTEKGARKCGCCSTILIWQLNIEFAMHCLPKNDTDTFNGDVFGRALPYDDGTSWEVYIAMNREMNPSVDSDVVNNLREDDAGVNE